VGSGKAGKQEVKKREVAGSWKQRGLTSASLQDWVKYNAVSVYCLNMRSTMLCTRGAMMSIAGIATAYAIPHDLNQIFRKLPVNPIFTEMSVKEIMPVVTMPIIMAKAILFFMVVRFVLILYRSVYFYINFFTF
jgi:hypothetical protein